MSQEPVKVNNVNKTAVLGAIAKMKADEKFGGAAPVVVKCIFDPTTAICHEPSFAESLRAGPVPAVAASSDATVPSILSYCPMAAAGCYSIVLMIQAATKDWQFTSYETETTATMDMSRFYNPTAGADVPWKAVQLDVTVDGDITDEVRNHMEKLQCWMKRWPRNVSCYSCVLYALALFSTATR